MKESERAQRIIEHYLNGMTATEAAKAEGVSRGYIAHITSCYNIKRQDIINGIIAKDCGIKKTLEPEVKLSDVKAMQARDPFNMAMKAIQSL